MVAEDTAPPFKQMTLIDRARSALADGEVIQAKWLLRRAIVDVPWDAKAVFNLAVLLAKTGRSLQARHLFNRIRWLNRDGLSNAKVLKLQSSLAATRDVPFTDASAPNMANILTRVHYISDARRRMCLVYQAGRVGSTAVHDVLERSLPGRYVGNHHILSERGCATLAAALSAFARTGRGAVRFAYAARVSSHMGDFVRGHLKKALREGRPIDVVTMVRAPLDHEISTFLFHVPLLFPAWREVVAYCGGPGFFSNWFRSYLETLGLVGRDNLARNLLERDVGQAMFVQSSGIERWFETELKTVLGVDIAQLGLHDGAPYALTHWPWGRLLAMRHEAMRECSVAALTEFVGRPVATIAERNTTGQNTSKDFEKEFRETLSLPDELIASHLDTRYSHVLGYRVSTAAPKTAEQGMV